MSGIEYKIEGGGLGDDDLHLLMCACTKAGAGAAVYGNKVYRVSQALDLKIPGQRWMDMRIEPFGDSKNGLVKISSHGTKLIGAELDGRGFVSDTVLSLEVPYPGGKLIGIEVEDVSIHHAATYALKASQPQDLRLSKITAHHVAVGVQIFGGYDTPEGNQTWSNVDLDRINIDVSDRISSGGISIVGRPNSTGMDVRVSRCRIVGHPASVDSSCIGIYGAFIEAFGVEGCIVRGGGTGITGGPFDNATFANNKAINCGFYGFEPQGNRLLMNGNLVDGYGRSIGGVLVSGDSLVNNFGVNIVNTIIRNLRPGPAVKGIEVWDNYYQVLVAAANIEMPAEGNACIHLRNEGAVTGCVVDGAGSADGIRVDNAGVVSSNIISRSPSPLVCGPGVVVGTNKIS